MYCPRCYVVLRLVVFGLALTVAIKILSQPRARKLEPEPKEAQKDILRFWADGQGKVREPAKQTNPQPAGGGPQEPQVSTGEEARHCAPPASPNWTPTPPLRVVHLDLKGAAPKIKYLEQIFPLFSSLGATGVLLEYEDMFPYDGELKVLRSPYAYSVEDIRTIRDLAQRSNLQIIPLVQVFGHLEFVLKHEQYHSLREVADYPNSLNPHAPGSQTLNRAMLEQVLEQHPDSAWLHIGADEVFGLGESQDSKNWLQSNKGDKGKMYLDHVTTVASIIREKRPGIQLLMWDDMLRQINSNTLKSKGPFWPANLASPMMWFYNAQLNLKAIDQLIITYQDVGFSDIWFASAFKGRQALIRE
ncbi:hypothetical protein AGOR_G00221200 [Albula goreensis]|uniref:beta-N-acetylhexosaminidase n=1 Tax=Albula goreensis TaxID=1534307 RepID=A0A8T3CMD7_9TELE|nr:hypothetical protein AGOR_G00221200 [Albula goreensis]